MNALLTFRHENMDLSNPYSPATTTSLQLTNF